MILRLPIQVQLLNNRGEVVKSISSTKKSRIRLRLHDVPRADWAVGTCRVWYNKPNDFWNEFTFTNLTQLEAGLITVTEKPLIDFLKPEIPAQYLEKRQLTPAQQRAIQKARSKSAMQTRMAV